MHPIDSRRVYLPALIAIACALGCSRPMPTSQPVDAGSRSAVAVSPHDEALRRDPDAMDEGLREALRQFRDKFQCNGISGCKSEQTLVEYGWAARPYLEQLFQQAPPQASYRTRTVRTIAQLRDPSAQAFLVHVLQDRDPEAKAYAIWGLGLLDAKNLRNRFEHIAKEATTPWLAPPRLTALWALHRWGDVAAGEQFLQQLRVLSGQQMAGPALTWAAELCMREEAPDCRTVLPLLARHPGFTTRRQAARAMAARPVHGYEPALTDLSGDTVRSISEHAMTALQQLTGLTYTDAAAWRQWCAQTHCQAMENLPRDATPSLP